MIEVVPAIIAKNFGELDEKVKLVEPYVSRAQIDIMDGSFVQNETIKGYDEIGKLNSKLKFEVHLMVDDPMRYVEKFLETKMVDRYVIHIESSGDFNNLIAMVHEGGSQFGFSLNPQTLNEAIAEYLDSIDFVQFMTVDPGFYGSPFIENVLDKMSDLHYARPDMPLQADGGIDDETGRKAVEAGASTLVSGSYIFNGDNVSDRISRLQKAGE